MATIPKATRRTKLEHVFQCLIVLPNTDPLVWRRIQVPETYSLWDLHVAIQDAMGWKDYHLHEFIVLDSKTNRSTRIGIPDDEMPAERPCLAGWKTPITGFLTYGTSPVRYRYDFGDEPTCRAVARVFRRHLRFDFGRRNGATTGPVYSPVWRT